MNQTDEVLSYLRAHGSITPIDALNQLGIMRLAARVFDLRRAGHTIIETTELTDGGKRYARYRLEEHASQPSAVVDVQRAEDHRGVETSQPTPVVTSPRQMARLFPVDDDGQGLLAGWGMRRAEA